MQNRYAGDVGDFGKFSLLQTLAGDELALGVVWYLNETEERNTDGAQTSHGLIAERYPDLRAKLAAIVESGKRSVEALERADILPPTTRYFNEPLPVVGKPSQWRQTRAARARWARQAVDAVSKADIVFLDPDNGLEVSSTSPSKKNSVKYVLKCELAMFLKGRNSVVLYQHFPREQRGGFIKESFMFLSDFGLATWAIQHGNRAYFILAAPNHRRRLWERSLKFVDSLGENPPSFVLWKPSNVPKE